MPKTNRTHYVYFALPSLFFSWGKQHACSFMSIQAIATVKRRHLSVALFVMFVVYATVSYTVFETFVCDTLDDGTSYLRADYSITCTTPLHMGYKIYAALMVVVYPVGFPCVFGWWLFKYRNELTEEDRRTNPEIRPLADLWEPYKRDKYYYEVGDGSSKLPCIPGTTL